MCYLLSHIYLWLYYTHMYTCVTCVSFSIHVHVICAYMYNVYMYSMYIICMYAYI